MLERVPGAGRREEYELTAKGASLWPVVRGLMTWGDSYYAPTGPRRPFRHVADDAVVDAGGRCTGCGLMVEVTDTVVAPGPGLVPGADDDLVTAALAQPHRLLEPLRG